MEAINTAVTAAARAEAEGLGEITRVYNRGLSGGVSLRHLSSDETGEPHQSLLLSYSVLLSFFLHTLHDLLLQLWADGVIFTGVTITGRQFILRYVLKRTLTHR